MDKCKNSTVHLNREAKGRTLHLLVEELGRINYFQGLDRKVGSRLSACTNLQGVRSAVLADGEELLDWTECGINTERVGEHVAELQKTLGSRLFATDVKNAPPAPGVYLSQFQLRHHEHAEPGLHSFFDPLGWGKGQLFVNGFNLGRYWPSAGPQRTLYVPGSLLDLSGRTANSLVLINFAPRPAVGTFSFVPEHIWE